MNIIKISILSLSFFLQPISNSIEFRWKIQSNYPRLEKLIDLCFELYLSFIIVIYHFVKLLSLSSLWEDQQKKEQILSHIQKKAKQRRKIGNIQLDTEKIPLKNNMKIQKKYLLKLLVWSYKNKIKSDNEPKDVNNKA